MMNRIYPHYEISRIIAAAVVSPEFCHALLDNPRQAIESGFGEETFSLQEDEVHLLAAIRASSLEEFAAKVVLT
jgi:hypothetical protein